MSAIATTTPNGPVSITAAFAAAMQRATAGYGGLMRLAWRAGISPKTLTRYRDGEREPRLSELMRLADADAEIRDALVRQILAKTPEQRAAILAALEEPHDP